VFDANVLISGIAGFSRHESVPGELLRRVLRNEFALVTSAEVLGEVHRALSKDFFSRTLTETQRSELVGAAVKNAIVIADLEPVRGVASHPEDDLVLATAATSGADFLVTGDKQLLALESFRDIPIVTSRQFLAVLDLQNLGG
jgi:putative PIN family toxin of toxin-antitoxin system